LDGGIASGLNYYKASMQNIDLEDTLNLSERCLIDIIFILRFTHLDLPDNWTIAHPCFFAAAHNDSVCTPLKFKPMMEKYAKDLTTIDFYANHWLQFEASDQLNNEFETWLQEKFILS
jgi:soluble epoxide hydrolase / lipid-phosphate phosphatase